jgi:hypothetical protein
MNSLEFVEIVESPEDLSKVKKSTFISINKRVRFPSTANQNQFYLDFSAEA